MIEINTDIVQMESNTIRNSNSYIKDAEQDARYAKRNINYRVKRKRNISSRLIRVVNDIDEIDKKVGKICRTLDSASYYYEQCERNIVRDANSIFGGNSVNGNSVSIYGSTTQENTKSELYNKNFNYLEIIAQWSNVIFEGGIESIKGTVGKNALISNIFSGMKLHNALMNSDKKSIWKKVVGSSGAVSAVGEVITNTLSNAHTYTNLKRLYRFGQGYGDKIVLKHFLGLNKAIKDASKSSKWWIRVANNYKKTTFEPIKAYTKPGFKAAAKWAGVIFSGIVNTIDNFNEHGGITTRFAAETVIETGVDLGTAFVVGAATTAVVGATVTSAPVLLVAGATAGAIWALDSVTKGLTKKYMGEEKDFAETISDGFIDGCIVLNNAAELVTDNVKSFVGNTYNGIVNCFMNPIKFKPVAKWAWF